MKKSISVLSLLCAFGVGSNLLATGNKLGQEKKMVHFVLAPLVESKCENLGFKGWEKQGVCDLAKTAYAAVDKATTLEDVKGAVYGFQQGLPQYVDMPTFNQAYATGYWLSMPYYYGSYYNSWGCPTYAGSTNHYHNAWHNWAAHAYEGNDFNFHCENDRLQGWTEKKRAKYRARRDANNWAKATFAGSVFDPGTFYSYVPTSTVAYSVGCGKGKSMGW